MNYPTFYRPWSKFHWSHYLEFPLYRLRPPPLVGKIGPRYVTALRIASSVPGRPPRFFFVNRADSDRRRLEFLDWATLDRDVLFRLRC
jgi:hypothetical protein